MLIRVNAGPIHPIPVIWSPDTRRHDPKHEIWVGVPTPGTEVSARVDVILEALAGRPQVEATSHPATALHTVHDPALVDFLGSVHDRWLEGEYVEQVGQDRVVPYFFPTPAMTSGMTIRDAPAVHALAGRFAYDTMTTVGPGTWQAVAAAADCALTAAALVAAGTPTAYALARPPGHHATPAGYGGSCYLNNAALAAQALRDSGHERVAVVDVDAHHGNGTQAIFWERADVLYGSLHVDPGAGWFPHVLGYADETGSGAGRGTTATSARAGHRRPRLAGRAVSAQRLGDRRRLRRAGGLPGCRRGRRGPREPLGGHRRGLPRRGRTAGRPRGPGSARAGRWLPPAEPRRSGRGLSRRPRTGCGQRHHSSTVRRERSVCTSLMPAWLARRTARLRSSCVVATRTPAARRSVTSSTVEPLRREADEVDLAVRSVLEDRVDGAGGVAVEDARLGERRVHRLLAAVAAEVDLGRVRVPLRGRPQRGQSAVVPLVLVAGVGVDGHHDRGAAVARDLDQLPGRRPAGRAGTSGHGSATA